MTALDVVRLPWEKRSSETIKAFTAFALYRDLGPERSLTKVAQALNEARTRKDRVKPESIRTQLGEWSVTHEWVDRVEAYDLELDRRRREALETEQVKASRAQAQAGGQLLALGLRRAAGTQDGRVQAIDPNTMDASDVARFIEVGTRVQRLGLGMATDLLKGAIALSPTDFNKLVGGIIDLGLEHMPAGKHAAYLAQVEQLLS